MEPIIQISQLNYSYPDGTIALQDINLEINSREKVALVGANGAGKSTLLLHINGVINASNGIFINGLNSSRKNLGRIRAMVGVVFQNPDDQLFSITVHDDVAFGPRYQGLSNKEINTRVEAALNAVQMQGFRDRHPYHLSGGEKKRIAIATVLSMEPAILVFDEPTAGLDPRARRELIELLQTLPQTLIIATHDLGLVEQLTPRTIIMNNGCIVADGSSAELLNNKDILFENGLI